MKIFKSFKVLNKEINFNEIIGFVPTMGSLHKGHIALIKYAQKKSKKVLVSIFINPTQFNEKKDFKNYPRNINKDILVLKKLKVNYLFTPGIKEVYKPGIKKKLIIQNKDKILCAKYRKGHFEGVLAVLRIFLKNINSEFLFLGEKDYQQVFLTKKYLQDSFNTKIISFKSIRKNKLPFSSRNKLLSSTLIKKSEKISKLLFQYKKEIPKNFKNHKLHLLYRSRIEKLCDKIEYFEIRNANNLSTKITKNNYKLFIAYRQNNIRLIDNL